MLEHLARIVGRRGYTFLFGNRVFGAVDKILSGALDSHDGEEAERNGQDLACRLTVDSAVYAAAYGFRQIGSGKARMAIMAFARFHGFGIENDRIGDLENGDRQIRSGLFRVCAAAEVLRSGFALKDIDVALAAVKDDLFLYDGDSFDLLRSAHAGADLAYDLDIHRDADLIKTAVERYGIHMYVRANHLGALRANASASFEKIASRIRKINDDVLIAVLITAAVENPICIYIYRITALSAACRRSISDIWHKNFPSEIIKLICWRKAFVSNFLLAIWYVAKE